MATKTRLCDKEGRFIQPCPRCGDTEHQTFLNSYQIPDNPKQVIELWDCGMEGCPIGSHSHQTVATKSTDYKPISSNTEVQRKLTGSYSLTGVASVKGADQK